MAYNVHITKNAENDLDEIVTYISDKLYNPNAANKLLDDFLNEKANLEVSPYMYPLSHDAKLQSEGYHRFIFYKNYVALYLIDEDKKEVWIMRIFYAKMDYAKLI